MFEHVFLPAVEIAGLLLLPAHSTWLAEWLDSTNDDVENGDIAASTCLQAAITELVLYGSTRHNWLEVFDDFLTDEAGRPLAYSEEYARRLYLSDAQWRQTPVHAIHAKWWMQKLYGSADEMLATLTANLKQPDGWFYDRESSETVLPRRMRTELTMGMAMALEVLADFGQVAMHQTECEATLSAFPRTAYLSAEYFRGHALTILEAAELMPVGLGQVIERCEAQEGYCDFFPGDKVGDYMGTTTRSGKDLAVHSPLAALHARYLASSFAMEAAARVGSRLESLGEYLRANPLDIRAFTIRDRTEIPFGTGISPLEVIAAVDLTQSGGAGDSPSYG